jgi:hypothetical protein
MKLLTSLRREIAGGKGIVVAFECVIFFTP